MNTIINEERLARTFMEVVQIDSISREEAGVAAWLVPRLEDLGASVTVDDAGQKVGGDTGNVIALIPGLNQADPLLLSAHMDTVEPGRGIHPCILDGTIASQGGTILGADDKSAIAIILEVLQCLREQSLSHGPLEVVFSICEEIGLLGAKNMDFGLLKARNGYVLDTSNHRALVTRAPAANQFKFTIFGRAAHAGGAPERGINAIGLAARAIAGLSLGRIDHETTCNIGIIHGGLATNIVPASVVAEGEVRSHDARKLEQVTQQMVSAFKKAIASVPRQDGDSLPHIESDVRSEFEALAVTDDHPTVRLARQAADDLGFTLASVTSGGGSDANVFARHGITIPVLGTGMRDVHTVDETIRVEDMVVSAHLLFEIVRRHGGGNIV